VTFRDAVCGEASSPSAAIALNASCHKEDSTGAKVAARISSATIPPSPGSEPRVTEFSGSTSPTRSWSSRRS
jgi:hypothetical protein